MQLKKKQLVQKVGLAIFGATLALSASADTFTASVTTIDDVSITPVQPLDFGSTIMTTAGTCVMTAALPGSTLMEFQTSATGASGGTYGGTTNTSGACIDTPGSDTSVTPGIWRISGAAGIGVNLLVSQIAQASADYTFSPTGGCYVLFDGAAAAADSDSCATLTPGTVVTSATAKLSIGAGEAHIGDIQGVASTAGDLLFTIGGTITIVNALTAETDYPLTFQVDVTY